MKSPIKKLTNRPIVDRLNWNDRAFCYFEIGSAERIFHKSSVKIKELKKGTFINARMLYYTENGVYIEADSLLLPGTEIYLGIKDSPFLAFANVYDVYRAEVVWLKLLNSGPYKYGYGIKFIVARHKSN